MSLNAARNTKFLVCASFSFSFLWRSSCERFFGSFPSHAHCYWISWFDGILLFHIYPWYEQNMRIQTLISLTFSNHWLWYQQNIIKFKIGNNLIIHFQLNCVSRIVCTILFVYQILLFDNEFSFLFWSDLFSRISDICGDEG